MITLRCWSRIARATNKWNWVDKWSVKRTSHKDSMSSQENSLLNQTKSHRKQKKRLKLSVFSKCLYRLGSINWSIISIVRSCRCIPDWSLKKLACYSTLTSNVKTWPTLYHLCVSSNLPCGPWIPQMPKTPTLLQAQPHIPESANQTCLVHNLNPTIGYFEG